MYKVWQSVGRFTVLLFMGLMVGITGYAQDNDNTALINTLMADVEPELIQSHPSFDGLFLAEVTAYPCTAIDDQEWSYEQLDIINTDSGESETVAEQLIACGGLGGYGLSALRWTENFLYYTDAREGTPDGFSLMSIPSIWQVDLSTLQVQNLGKALFSPDSAWIISWVGDTLHLLADDGVEVAEFPMTPENLSMTQLLWLPDSRGIIYIQADMPFGSTQSVVTHLDIETMEQTIILTTGQ